MLLERIDGKISKGDISLNNYQTQETGDKNQEGTPDWSGVVSPTIAAMVLVHPALVYINC